MQNFVGGAHSNAHSTPLSSSAFRTTAVCRATCTSKRFRPSSASSSRMARRNVMMQDRTPGSSEGGLQQLTA